MLISVRSTFMFSDICSPERQREEGRRPGAGPAAGTKGRWKERYPPDEVPVGVGAPAEAHGAVAVEKLLEKGAAGQPHPAARVHAPVGIQEQLLKHLQQVGHAQVSLRSQLSEQQFIRSLLMNSVNLLVSTSFIFIIFKHHQTSDKTRFQPPRHYDRAPPVCIAVTTSCALTFIPSSQLIHRSPLVRKQATACLAK